GQEEHNFTRLVAVDASEPQRGLTSTYRVGDVLQFHQNAAGGIKKGNRMIVSDPAKVPLSLASKFTLYRPETIKLSAGDKIRGTGTVTTTCGKHKLRNGSVQTVAGFTKTGIKLKNGWVIPNDAGHFRMGWVDTSFSSQGKTVQRA